MGQETRGIRSAGPYIYATGRSPPAGLERVKTRVHIECNTRMAREFEEETSVPAQAARRLFSSLLLNGQPASDDDAKALTRWLLKTELLDVAGLIAEVWVLLASAVASSGGDDHTNRSLVGEGMTTARVEAVVFHRLTSRR